MLTKVVTVILLLSAVHQVATAGEVYRWVDETGKVHFSDSANKSLIEQKKQQMIKAKAIDLKPVNSADPSDSFSETYSDMKETEQRKKLAAKQAQQQAQARENYKREKCKEWLATYNSYGNRPSEYAYDGQQRTITYMVDDNGKALTEKQQQKELEIMRRRLVSLGCL